METERKEQYEAPEIQVVELSAEGIVCGSGGPADYHRYSPVDW